jgi:hypothetical protein
MPALVLFASYYIVSCELPGRSSITENRSWDMISSHRFMFPGECDGSCKCGLMMLTTNSLNAVEWLYMALSSIESRLNYSPL